MTTSVGTAKTHALDAAVSGIGVVSLEAGGVSAPATMDVVPSMCSHIDNRLGFDILLFAEIFKLNPPVFVTITGGFV